ncbi:hypothetical protein BSKO_12765 [Bryopsis sp. KO-2023]|nr:hypothetical protein BSKO_12765 [Bryopsis sp. KO-2023]
MQEWKPPSRKNWIKCASVSELTQLPGVRLNLSRASFMVLGCRSIQKFCMAEFDRFSCQNCTSMNRTAFFPASGGYISVAQEQNNVKRDSDGVLSHENSLCDFCHVHTSLAHLSSRLDDILIKSKGDALLPFLPLHSDT